MKWASSTPPGAHTSQNAASIAGLILFTDEKGCRIDIGVPGNEIVVNRDQSEDVYVALRDAFNAAKRQLEDYVNKIRGNVKSHEAKRMVERDRLLSGE